jgi:hypothetical protein
MKVYLIVHQMHEIERGLPFFRGVFKYKERNFAEKWADDFVDQDFSMIRRHIVEIGSTINTFLREVGV